jgi:hypothetical protein
MAGNPRENAEGKGFWDGGTNAHGTNKESSGRASGFPGRRTPTRTGYRTDLEFPQPPTTESTSRER